MAPFEFKLENHFVGSSDGTSLQVYELTKSSAHFSSMQKADWKKVATIPKQDDVDDDAAYDGLLFFNSHERIEEPEVLTMLAEHLKELRLLASPEGYCFQRVSEFGVHYLRLNDLFSWPRYGVKLVTISTWSRLELKLLKDDDDHYDLEEEANKSKDNKDDKDELRKSAKWTNINVVVWELQRQLRKKDVELRMLKRKKNEEDKVKEERIQELEKLNEALEEVNETKDEELQKLAAYSKNMISDLQRQLKRKDDQLEMLKKMKVAEEEAGEKRIAELEKQNEDLEEAKRTKDKELQKLQKQLKKKDGELHALKKKAEEKSNRIEELEKMFEELEEENMRIKEAKEDEVSKLKKAESELRKLLKLKENELQTLRKKKQDDEEAKLSKLREELEARKNTEVEKLRKEKDDAVSKILQEKNDEAAKTRKVEGELKEAREKLSSSVAEVAEVKRELEKCQRNSWAFLLSTKFIKPENLDFKGKYLATRQRVPLGTFVCASRLQNNSVSNSPKLVDKMPIDENCIVRWVDEERSSRAEWPRLPLIFVYLGTDGSEFDQNNWWYLKTTHPEGGLTMLVYYEGDRSQISITSFGGNFIPLPFPKDLELYSWYSRFSIFRLEPFGVRFGFTYRY